MSAGGWTGLPKFSTYKKSEMVLAIHSDAFYLSESKARSREGGHWFVAGNE